MIANKQPSEQKTSITGWAKQSFSLYPQLVSMPFVSRFNNTELVDTALWAETAEMTLHKSHHKSEMSVM